MTWDTVALIGRAHQGDKEARDILFHENTGLIYSVAHRFLGRGAEMEDLFQIGSIGLLKSGIGIIVILSVTIVFMPVILQGVMWMFTLWIGKSTAEVLNLNGPAKLLENISSVFSTLIAVLLCIMSIYILSTAAVIMLGGGSS